MKSQELIKQQQQQQKEFLQHFFQWIINLSIAGFFLSCMPTEGSIPFGRNKYPREHPFYLRKQSQDIVSKWSLRHQDLQDKNKKRDSSRE